MHAPPDQQTKGAALPGNPRSFHLPCDTESSEAVREVQAASLRRRFAIGYCVAAALAPLVCGLPR